MPDLFSNGFAVQFVVDFPDLGHSECRDRECIETEGDLLLWHQRHWGGRCYLCLRVFTWDNKKSDEVRHGENRQSGELKETRVTLKDENCMVNFSKTYNEVKAFLNTTLKRKGEHLQGR